jgi:hypothetical protein
MGARRGSASHEAAWSSGWKGGLDSGSGDKSAAPPGRGRTRRMSASSDIGVPANIDEVSPHPILT